MIDKADELEALKGLGPKSSAALKAIGINTRLDLEKLGPVKTFIKLQKESTLIKPSLNFLYALVGALEDRDWKDVAKKEKQRLLIELDSYQELNSLTGSNNPDEPGRKRP